MIKGIPEKKVVHEEEKNFIDVLKIFAPGTSIRLALEDILRMGMGALIVVETKNLLEIAEKGFRVNTKFSAQKLAELAKMDGALILSRDLKKILYANAFLFPSIQISTKETGTRHKAAERTAKQLNTIVIAVSERKNKITIYYGDIRYELETSSEVLRRAAETLQILEKHKEILDNLMVHINILEINNLVTTSDVCSVLQRIEIMRRISDIVKRDLVKLGKEGIIVSMRLKELTKNLDKERMMILKDYFKSKYLKTNIILKNMDFDFLLETSDISRLLFGDIYDKLLFSKGIRILNKTGLSEKNIELLTNNFKKLNEIFDADKKSLMNILKDEKVVDSLLLDLRDLKEKILVGKNF